MKKVLLALLVVVVLVSLSACTSSDDVTFTEDELEEITDSIEEVEDETTELSYAPAVGDVKKLVKEVFIDDLKAEVAKKIETEREKMLTDDELEGMISKVEDSSLLMEDLKEDDFANIEDYAKIEDLKQNLEEIDLLLKELELRKQK